MRMSLFFRATPYIFATGPAKDANGNPKGPQIWPFGVRKYEKSVWCLGLRENHETLADDDFDGKGPGECRED